MTIQDRVASRFLYLKLAMSLEDAKRALGFPPDAQPSDSEVAKAYKQKVLENHPDRGGDLRTMVEINKAKEVLDGKEPPSGGGWSPSDYAAPSQSQRAKPTPIVVTFDDARAKANVPSADWKFKTTTGFSGYAGTSASGFVLCGKKAEGWVFVAVERFKSANAFTGTVVDEWWMLTREYTGDLRSVAPRAIRELWEMFPHLTKGYNAKVEILPEGTPLTAKLMLTSGRDMAFKDALDIMGELSEADPWKGRKLQVTMVLNSKGLGPDQQKSIDLIVNGREFSLKHESIKFIEDQTKILPLVFGSYIYWAGDKKVLTKSKAGKTVLEGLAKRLTHEPQQLRDALAIAATQMVG